MILVRETFVAKPGNASKMAKLFVEVMKDWPAKYRILTDMTGQFNRVVVETEVENLTAYEKLWEDTMKDTPQNKAMGQKMAGYTEMYETGYRDFYKIW
jgi:hypothetical protein